MRKSLVIGATALLLSLTACAPGATNDPVFEGAVQVCEPLETGSASDQIKVTEGDAAPTAEFPTPLTSDVIETKIIREGEGPVITGGQLVRAEYVGFNAGTGETIQSSKFDGSDMAAINLTEGAYPDFCHALTGVKQGSLVAILLPPEFAHEEQGIPDLGVATDQAVIFILEIDKVYLPRALGQAQAAQAGFPAVVLAPEGVPGVTVPKTSAPTELKVATLIEGRGEVVAEDQLVTVHYSGFTWADNSKFDSSWDRMQPSQFQLSEGQVIDGFRQSLVGQKIGSQVLVVVPPSLGYGDQAQGQIPANSTLVFVVDILGADDVN